MSGPTGTVNCLLRAWQSHEGELLAFLKHQLSEPAAAQDLLQEVFLKSMLQGSRFCTVDNPRAWLFSVARHALVDHHRAKKPLDPLPDDIPAPEHEARAPVDELDGCVRLNLGEMRDEDRDIIENCDLAGMTVRDYAEAKNLTLAAAKSRLLRARQRLRAALVRNCQVRFDDNGRVCCHVPRDAS